jgi:hypothetical protein
VAESCIREVSASTDLAFMMRRVMFRSGAVTGTIQTSTTVAHAKVHLVRPLVQAASCMVVREALEPAAYAARIDGDTCLAYSTIATASVL